MGFGDSWREAREKRKEQDAAGMTAWDRARAGAQEAREKQRVKNEARAERRAAKEVAGAERPTWKEAGEHAREATREWKEEQRKRAEPVLADADAMERARAKFNRAVDDRIADGWRLESRTDSIAVVVRGSRPSHLLHLVLTLLTLGLWLLVWVNLATWGGQRHSTIRVHDDGSVVDVTQLPGPLKSWPPRTRKL